MQRDCFIVCLALVCLFVSLAHGQEGPKLSIYLSSVRSVEPIRSHIGVTDTRIELRLKNNSAGTVCVYGNRNGNEFNPFYYMMRYDLKAGDWIFPTSNGRPLDQDKLVGDANGTRRMDAGQSLDLVLLGSRTKLAKGFRVAIPTGCDMSVDAKWQLSGELTLSAEDK